jgi:hypothetical protein
VKYHLGLLENDRQGLIKMESGKVDKQQDSKVDTAAVDEKRENKKEEDAVKGVSRDPIEWANKEKACAQLRVYMPDVEKWGIELLWNMMEEVRKDPEGLDIEKLHADAVSSLDEVTSSYEVAAGGSDVTMYSLVMKKWMKVISVARKRSLEKINSELVKGEVQPEAPPAPSPRYVVPAVPAGVLGWRSECRPISRRELLVAFTNSRLLRLPTAVPTGHRP